MLKVDLMFAFYRCSDWPNVSCLRVLSSCLMIDEDINESRHVFSSLVTFNCTFILCHFAQESLSVTVRVCVGGSSEDVSGSDMESDCEVECLTLCVLVSPLHVPWRRHSSVLRQGRCVTSSIRALYLNAELSVIHSLTHPVTSARTHARTHTQTHILVLTEAEAKGKTSSLLFLRL